MRLLRTVLFTPGNNVKMIRKAGTLAADALILDLEDAVPMSDKETARTLVRDSIAELSAKGLDLIVRVNALSTGLAGQDLEWVAQEGLVGIVLPKVESRDDVLAFARLIDQQEKKKGKEPGSLLLIPILETAKGVLNAYEVSMASQRIIAICFGALDYARDMGVTLSREGTELLYARSRLPISARAAGVQAIDTPWIDIADEEGLVREAEMARRLGFRGKLLIHPGQIEPVNRVFSPSQPEVEYATEVVAAFQASNARGVGAISLEGKMIDIANFRQAEDLLALVEAIAAQEERRYPQQ